MAPGLKNAIDKAVKVSAVPLVPILLFLIALISASSCSEKRPEGILSKGEMVQVLEDIYLAEEKVNHLALSRDSAREVAAAMTARVFERAAVTDSVFRKSIDYYMERPVEMELIYTALVDTLQLREQRAPMFTPDHQ